MKNLITLTIPAFLIACGLAAATPDASASGAEKVLVRANLGVSGAGYDGEEWSLTEEQIQVISSSGLVMIGSKNKVFEAAVLRGPSSVPYSAVIWIGDAVPSSALP